MRGVQSVVTTTASTILANVVTFVSTALSEESLSVSGVLLAKVFGNQARDTARYHEGNQRLAGLEVRQQMIGQGFYAIVQSFLSIGCTTSPAARSRSTAPTCGTSARHRWQPPPAS